jgi:hypothetical protein
MRKDRFLVVEETFKEIRFLTPVSNGDIFFTKIKQSLICCCCSCC